MNFDEESFARMIERTGGGESPRPEHLEQLRKQVLEAFDRAQTPKYQVKFPKHLLSNWRYIMRHPISRITAAAIFIFVLGGVVIWFHGGGAKAAFADLIDPILNAKSAKYKSIIEIEGQPPQTAKSMFLAPNRFRNELSSGMVQIIDNDTGKMVMLTPINKYAVVSNITNMPKDKSLGSYFTNLQSKLSEVQHKPDTKLESLGQQEIEGHKAIGYRISDPAMEMTLWGDPETNLPLRVEMSTPAFKNMKVIMIDFVFNEKLDESLFSTVPPADYTVNNAQWDLSPPSEKDLIESLRYYSELANGVFPNALNINSMMPMLMKIMEKEGMMNAWMKGQKPNQEQYQRYTELSKKLLDGIQFTIQSLSSEADAHYAGKGVKFGAADTPIFWYRPKDSKTYRVIYADLSVKDAETPPDVPNAQAISTMSKPEK